MQSKYRGFECSCRRNDLPTGDHSFTFIIIFKCLLNNMPLNKEEGRVFNFGLMVRGLS
jgi:hypothetical protein